MLRRGSGLEAGVTPETFSFELAANHLHDAVFVLDSSARILWANPAAASVAGRKPDSLINLKLTVSDPPLA